MAAVCAHCESRVRPLVRLILTPQQDSNDQLAAFHRRALHTRREWRDLAQAYLDAQALKQSQREDDDTDSDSGDDSFVPVWPAVPPQPANTPAVVPQLAISQIAARADGDIEISQHGAGSPVRTTIGRIHGEKNAGVVKRVFARQPLFTHEVYDVSAPRPPSFRVCIADTAGSRPRMRAPAVSPDAR